MKIDAMKKDDFYRQMFKLTIPIIIQNLLSAAVNSADVIMLNYGGTKISMAVNWMCSSGQYQLPAGYCI